MLLIMMMENESNGSGKRKPVVVQKRLSIRDQHLSRMHKMLDSYLNENIVNELESCVYENLKGHKDFESRYKQKISLLIQHLYPHSLVGNTYLGPKLLSGEFTPKHVAEIKTEADLNPHFWRCAQLKAVEAKQIAHGAQRALSDLMPCGKCGGKTEHIEMQTRSCDEAMTVKVFCPKCKIRFTV